MFPKLAVSRLAVLPKLSMLSLLPVPTKIAKTTKIAMSKVTLPIHALCPTAAMRFAQTLS
jgi:hypothetical protein